MGFLFPVPIAGEFPIPLQFPARYSRTMTAKQFISQGFNGSAALAPESMVGDTYRANRIVGGTHVRIECTWDGARWVDGPVVAEWDGKVWRDAR